MFCKNCGAKLPENGTVCPNCGERVVSNSSQTINYNTGERGPYKVFATIGLVTSICALVICWIPWMWLLFIAPLVLSILGHKSEINHGRAVAGLIMSVLAICLSFAMTFFLYSLIFG